MTTQQLSRGYTARFGTDARLIAPGNLAVGYVDSSGKTASATRVPIEVPVEFFEAVREWGGSRVGMED